jgi:hypothetical protein
MMSEIYSKAFQVVISQGEPTLDSNEAMDFMFRLRTAILTTSKAIVGSNHPSFDAILQAGGIPSTSTA